MTKPVKAWAATIDGYCSIAREIVQYGDNDPYAVLAIFTSRQKARKHYQGVFPVLITPIERSKRGKASKKPRRKSR